MDELPIPISGLLLTIGLAVFMINAEMLESKYLIGIKNTFEVDKTFLRIFHVMFPTLLNRNLSSENVWLLFLPRWSWNAHSHILNDDWSYSHHYDLLHKGRKCCGECIS